MSSASLPESAASTIARDDLIRALAGGRIVLVDVLSRESFAANHIPGAINLPVAEILGTAAAVIPDRHADIVAYCGGPT
jgi:rhodanese-related sulfurtransferase